MTGRLKLKLATKIRGESMSKIVSGLFMTLDGVVEVPDSADTRLPNVLPSYSAIT